MNRSPQQPSSARAARVRLVAVMLGLALIAASCGSEAAAPADPIETNDGGILVSPPDVLEGNPEPTRVPAIELPPPVEGLNATPVVAFEYFDGTPASTAQFTGRPTVVNFWASNCPACIAEMPEFEETFQALGSEVDFVGVNTADVSRDAAVRLAGQTGVTYPLIDDTDSAVFRSFGGFVMPTTVLLNPQGQVAFSWSGVLTGEELTRLINEHILLEQ